MHTCCQRQICASAFLPSLVHEAADCTQKDSLTLSAGQGKARISREETLYCGTGLATMHTDLCASETCATFSCKKI